MDMLRFRILTPARAVVAAGPGAEGAIPDTRCRAIGWLLAIFPLATIAGHFIECARVHDLFFYPFEFAPAALAVAVPALVV